MRAPMVRVTDPRTRALDCLRRLNVWEGILKLAMTGSIKEIDGYIDFLSKHDPVPAEIIACLRNLAIELRVQAPFLVPRASTMVSEPLFPPPYTNVRKR